ncbi:MAG TPA: trypsin-like peptidase domain-containing protein, partial [Chroococcales cyanobacterium]
MSEKRSILVGSLICALSIGLPVLAEDSAPGTGTGTAPLQVAPAPPSGAPVVIPVTPTPPTTTSPTSADAAIKAGIPLTSSTIADIAQRVAPAVVNIEVDSEITAPTMNIPSFALPFFFNMPFGGGMGGGGGNLQQFFNGRPVRPGPNGGIQGQSESSPGPTSPHLQGQLQGQFQAQRPQKIERHNKGSGFIIRDDGYILTNAHVVRNSSKINVTLNDGRNFVAKIVGIDSFSDIAIIKIDGTNLPTAVMGDSSLIRPGEFAIAIGSPLGYDHTV